MRVLADTTYCRYPTAYPSPIGSSPTFASSKHLLMWWGSLCGFKITNKEHSQDQRLELALCTAITGNFVKDVANLYDTAYDSIY